MKAVIYLNDIYFLRKECFGAGDIKRRISLIPNHTKYEEPSKIRIVLAAYSVTYLHALLPLWQ